MHEHDHLPVFRAGEFVVHLAMFQVGKLARSLGPEGVVDLVVLCFAEGGEESREGEDC